MTSSVSVRTRAKALHAFLGKQGEPTAGQLDLYQGVFDHYSSTGTAHFWNVLLGKTLETTQGV